jgi:hypothetical protein
MRPAVVRITWPPQSTTPKELIRFSTKTRDQRLHHCCPPILISQLLPTDDVSLICEIDDSLMLLRILRCARFEK